MNSARAEAYAKPAGSISNASSRLPASPVPHTPLRRLSSSFSSPYGGYRSEEEVVVIEIGCRHVCAGFAGEQAPRCTLHFGPEESRRVGDYRAWLPKNDTAYSQKRTRVEDIGNDHELWRLHLGDFDLAATEDKLERAIREVYTKYLMIDSKSRRVHLVVPSILPLPLLGTVLQTMFENYQMPSITLFSPSIMSCIAAGCRYGLVIDIGWRETIVTAVYDYREIRQARTTRAMKQMIVNVMSVLQCSKDRKHASRESLAQVIRRPLSPVMTSLKLDKVEDLVERRAWCKDSPPAQSKSNDQRDRSNPVPAQAQMADPLKPADTSQLPDISTEVLAEVVDLTFFGCHEEPRELDNEEHTISNVVFDVFTELPPDVRSVCMARIMLIGGGASITGLKARVLTEITSLFHKRGWNSVRGRLIEEPKERTFHKSASPTTNPSSTEIITRHVQTSQQSQVIDQIDKDLIREKSKLEKPQVSGQIRGVETLGPWAGTSLLGALRIKGVVELERDTYLQHGLAGPKRQGEGNAATATGPRKSYAADIPRAGNLGEKPAWTLGAWA